MVAMKPSRLPLSKLDGRVTIGRELTRMDNKPNFSRGMKLQWAGSRERNLASGRSGAFFLTSLFIELIDSATRLAGVTPVNEPFRG
jgi:hypothetical protein